MEFKSLKNIESSFRHLRLFGIIYLCVCTLLVGFSVWKAYSFAEAQREKIYALDEGKSLMLALSQDLEQNRNGLIITTACRGGLLSLPGYQERIRELRQIFGEDFFVEIQTGWSDAQIEFNRRAAMIAAAPSVGSRAA